MKALVLAGLCLSLAALPALPQDRRVVIDAPQTLIDTGLFGHILPRFKLKTQITVEFGEPAQITFVEDPESPVFAWNDRTIGIAPEAPDGYPGRFAEWLRSEVGQNTITAFGDGAFTRAAVAEAAVEEPLPEGDVVAGEELAHRHCGRCHVVSDRNRMGGIGSTPSFGAMKNFTDWKERFTVFYTLNPHPAFTQIDGLTEPFDPARPSPIAPVDIAFEDYEAILAYVARIPVKDLGGAIRSQ